MQEEFLHYFWMQYAHRIKKFQGTSDEQIEVESPGYYNTDSGPDFFNAKIHIDGILWCGNVEMHLRSSDWKKHKHHTDSAYNNVILHVVFRHDAAAETAHGTEIVTLELQHLISPQHKEKYHQFLWRKQEFPCSDFQKEIPGVFWRQQFDRALAQRLERKVKPFQHDYESTNGDMEEVAYRALARNFGFRVNALPFEWLSRNTPYKMVKKVRGNVLHTEALLFGQSGLLQRRIKDDYVLQLESLYQKVQEEFSLQPFEKLQWKFARMRPLNFPTIRIAQFAMFLHQVEPLSMISDPNLTLKELRQLLRVVASDYWNMHYAFARPSKLQPKSMGEASVDNLIVNTVVPLMFFNGQTRSWEELTERALQLLSELKPERNFVVEKWRRAGFSANGAADSQAFLEQWVAWCSGKKCVNCIVGNQILKPSDDQQNSSFF
jgi:hypothetical protein